MPQYGFGVGNLYLVNDASPAQVIRVGTLQDVSLDFSFTLKELRGQYQFPVDIARAGAKLSGKAKSGQLSSLLINSVLTGSTRATGSILVAVDEAQSIPATPGPYTKDVTNKTKWLEDLGVINVSTGVPMKRVTATPATGEYSVTSGTYTFAAADQGVAVLISYTYSETTGAKVTYTNQLMGSGTVYQLHLFNSFRSKGVYLKCHAVTFPKWALGFKQEDYSDNDFDFECFADSTGNVITWAQAE